MHTTRIAFVLALAGAACTSAVDTDEDGTMGVSESELTSTADTLISPNSAGEAATYTMNRVFDFNNPFFTNFGNGRVCATCHDKNVGWTITPEFVKARFDATGGTAPIFRLNDGANSPLANVSTVEARRAAYSMVLNKGVIRVGIGVPANADYQLTAVDDPYRYASANELSLFRRPLPTTNLRFVTTVMWDGRVTGPFTAAAFTDQANGATQGHAQALNPLTTAERNAIYGFEIGLFTAQISDSAAGTLYLNGGLGGPKFLSTQPFYSGINDVLGADPSGKPFNEKAFTIYNGWNAGQTGARAAIARGQAIFNSKKFIVSGVKGVNDALNIPALQSTCTTCHDSPNVGNHSLPLPLDLGLGDESRRTPDMPLYTFRHNQTGAIVKTTDPGRGLITGKFSDIGKFKGPVLRALATRAPYFHNGSAATLLDAVNFYDTRFQIGMTAAEKSDLVAFLRTL